MDVVFVVYPGCCALDLVGPSEVFSTANQLLGADHYSLRVAASARGPVHTESGLQMHADVALAEANAADTVIVTGGLGFEGQLADDLLLADLERLDSSTRRLGSVCTGSFLLAEAGLLDGRRATTHWAWADEFRRRYPKVHLDHDALYVLDDDRVTAAGVAAGIDLALALVALDHNAALARSVSHRMVVYLQRSGGQSQFSERTRPDPAIDGAIAQTIASVLEDPTAEHGVAQLAARAGMSGRSFARHFKATTGTTPARWVERARVDEARRLLEASEDSVATIAGQSGFASVHTMRQAFMRVIDLSPAGYRRVHRTTVAGPARQSG